MELTDLKRIVDDHNEQLGLMERKYRTGSDITMSAEAVKAMFRYLRAQNAHVGSYVDHNMGLHDDNN